MYRQVTDTVDGQLAVSLDGVNWSSHTDHPIIPCGEPGDPDQGSVYPGPELTACTDDTFRMILRSSGLYHNQGYLSAYRRKESSAFYQWAVWDAHRLAGVRADGDGRFTFRMPAGVERLVANFRADRDGWVKFSLADRSPWPPQPIRLDVPGHGEDDMKPLTGDHTHAPLAWQGDADLSALKERALFVTAHLHKATLFAVTGYGIDDPEARDDPRFPV